MNTFELKLLMMMICNKSSWFNVFIFMKYEGVLILLNTDKNYKFAVERSKESLHVIFR